MNGGGIIFSGYNTIASGIKANQKNLDVLSNNILNSETAGYRAERTLYSAYEMEVMSVIDRYGSTTLGDGIGSPVAVVDSLQTLFSPGTIESTDRSLDVAINGDGFFNVTGEDGRIYLTRDGGFDLDAEGYMILPGVGRVLGANGYIRAMRSDVTIGDDGTVTSAMGAYLGKLLISAPADYTTLERTENGLFTSAGITPASTNYRLLQNSLEQSNVNLNQELLNLVAAQRAFQSCSSALTTIDSINRRAAQQIAAV